MVDNKSTNPKGYKINYMIAVLFAYLLFVVILAWDNAKRIDQDKKIKHWLNGLAHLSMAGILYFVDWKLSVALLCLVRVTFDISLNLFRGFPIDYVSLKPKSVIDKIEKKIFGLNGYTPKIVYLIIAVCLLLVR